MTCTHVLDIVDADGLTRHTQSHLAAAWEHARHCPTCGPALDSARALTDRLRTLAQPSPAPDLAAVILARIERLEPAATPGAHKAATERTPATTPRPTTWLPVAGLAAGVAIACSLPEVYRLPPALMAPRLWGVGGAAPLTLPEPSWGLAALIVGLLLFAAGLLLPASERSEV